MDGWLDGQVKYLIGNNKEGTRARLDECVNRKAWTDGWSDGWKGGWAAGWGDASVMAASLWSFVFTGW